ncbi:urease subunit beta [Paenibacillus darwinianus]|uniref:Urease subunit beta n=1 Tax=Paenibacillus darwinianus TaxID=1380763 RepID=A0A9W5W6D8_9BACL|nr:urease subunit beta [Paenibacillus darwinianus]EXX84846.1 urease subunit beta [Paenibacillus darwinianus]EXX85447.1 urease subunit beta [Paenibacillus darwinianus]EXX85623.1 urease subunit beta [Paenibacillus darwinianus]
MIPGEYRTASGAIELNVGRRKLELIVVNTGDRPVQVGSHFHFFEVNRGMLFDREAAFGMRLDIPAGTAVRFEPGEEKPVGLTEIGGLKRSFGLNGLSRGEAVNGAMSEQVRERLKAWEGERS